MTPIRTVAIAARLMNAIILLMMKRAVIAVSWIAVTTVPVLLAAVMKFNCCALPVMPFCHMAAASHDDVQTQVPAHEKQQPVKRIVTPSLFAIAISNESRALAVNPQRAYRSFITLGATRCDHDVGLNVLLATFLI